MHISIVLWLVLVISSVIHSEDRTSHSTNENNFGFGLELILAKLESLELEIMSLKEQNRNLSELVSDALKRSDKSCVQVATNEIISTGEIVAEQDNVIRVDQNEPEIDESHVYSSCNEVPDGKTGKYAIRPVKNSKPFYAYCEMQINGGGWTVIQKRFNGSENFYRNWTDYKTGFGSLDGEFWFGLDRTHLMTSSQTHEIMFHLMDFKRTVKTAKYNPFSMGNEREGYVISSLGAYTGSAGDGFSYHRGMKFTTYDVDNDKFTTNCAKKYYGAWWYHACYKSNLNAKYINARTDQAMCWNPFNMGNDGLMSSMIMIRPV